MEVLVPFSTDRPKTRLSDVFSPGERESFARSMLADVLRAVIDAGGHPRLLATADIDPPIEVDTYVEADRHVEADAPANDPLPANGPLPADVPVTVDARPLTTAVNDALDRHEPTGSEPVAVVMADLALATPEALDRLFRAGGDVAIAPGRGGGTNALVVRDPAFRVDYHGASYLDHRHIAEEVGASVAVVDSHRLATDIDERSDLAELLIHGDGNATAWLRDAGVGLDATNGRVGVDREE